MNCTTVGPPPIWLELHGKRKNPFSSFSYIWEGGLRMQALGSLPPLSPDMSFKNYTPSIPRSLHLGIG